MSESSQTKAESFDDNVLYYPSGRLGALTRKRNELEVLLMPDRLPEDVELVKTFNWSVSRENK